MQFVAWIGLVVGAYLLGSIPFAVVTSRIFGLADPRSYGSGNPGATNVLRSGNKLAALLTLLGDAAKGGLAVWLAQQFAPAAGIGATGPAVAALAAFLGHLFPVFLSFKGGKGVATYLGAVLVLNPWVGLLACLVWALFAIFFRFSSLASIAAAIAAPLAQFFAWGFAPALPALALMSGFLIARHHKNISNLLAGKERRIGAKPTPHAN